MKRRKGKGLAGLICLASFVLMLAIANGVTDFVIPLGLGFLEMVICLIVFALSAWAVGFYG